MPTLPLPAVSPIMGDIPVTDQSDILAILPGFLKPSDPPPVRDAILAALVAMFQQYQLDAETAVGMSDVTRAVDYALTGLGADRGVFRSENEDDVDYRIRILGIPSLVTPTAIVAAVNNLLAPLTKIQCKYAEAVQDRWYLNDGFRATWHSYIWDTTQSMSPTYPDRIYQDDAAANSGYYLISRNPGGARVYSDAFGREFMIRIPDISGVDQLGAFVNSDSLIDRFYVGDTAGIASAIRDDGTTTLDTFNNIVTTIQRLKGHSIRFIVEMDPKLRS